MLENLANYLILHRCVTVGKNDADKSISEIAKHKINNWLVNIRTRKWRPSIADAFDAKRPAALLLEDSVRVFDEKKLRSIKGWDASKVPSEYSEPLKNWAPKKGAAKKKKEEAKARKKAKTAKGSGGGDRKKKGAKKPAGDKKKKPKSKKPAGGNSKGGETSPLDLLSSVAELSSSVVLSEATMPPIPDISPIAYTFGTSPIGTDGMMTEQI